MSDGVLATVTWKIKPELTDVFVEALRGMFPVTRTKQGFRSIRLLKSEAEPNAFILLQEWDSADHHRAYMQFRMDIGDGARLGAMCVSPPQIGYWSLDALAGARA